MNFTSTLFYRELSDDQPKFGLMKQIISGLHFLHVRGKAIIHGSIQPSNILVVMAPSGGHVTLKIADVTLHKYVDPDDKKALSGNLEGNLDFKPPEFWRPIKGKAPRYFTGSDMFSAGLLCIAMVQAEGPEYILTPRDLLDELDDIEKDVPFGKVMFDRNKNNLLPPRLVEDQQTDSALMGRVKVRENSNCWKSNGLLDNRWISNG